MRGLFTPGLPDRLTNVGTAGDEDVERKTQAEVLLNAYLRELERRRLAAGAQGLLISENGELCSRGPTLNTVGGKLSNAAQTRMLIMIQSLKVPSTTLVPTQSSPPLPCVLNVRKARITSLDLLFLGA